MKREHSPENVRLGKVVFFICIVLSMIAVTFCKGQNFNNVELPREKVGKFWYAYNKLAFDTNGDSVMFGSVFCPGPYDFKTIFVKTTGKNKCVHNLILGVYFESGAVVYLSAYNVQNCNGESWYSLSEDEKLKFRHRKITKVELFNPHTSDSFKVEDWEYQYYIAAINQ